jgi:hypothetical protein
MVGFVGLALIVGGVVAAVTVAVLAAPLVSDRSESERCSRCGAAIPAAADGCTVCEAPFEQPPAGAEEDDERPRSVYVELPEPDEEGTIVNDGIPRGLVKAAVVVMGVGLVVRVLGMLDPAGLSLGLSGTTTALVTVLGGLAMFAGFVVLDVA